MAQEVSHGSSSICFSGNVIVSDDCHVLKLAYYFYIYNNVHNIFLLHYWRVIAAYRIQLTNQYISKKLQRILFIHFVLYKNMYITHVNNALQRYVKKQEKAQSRHKYF